MRCLMISSFAALATSTAGLAAIFMMALYTPTQPGNGLAWTTNISRNIAPGRAPSSLATVTLINAEGRKIWVALQ
jgi:hypothetical protein